MKKSNKVILIVVLALIFVMAFSCFAFAAVTASDILQSFDFLNNIENSKFSVLNFYWSTSLLGGKSVFMTTPSYGFSIISTVNNFNSVFDYSSNVPFESIRNSSFGLTYPTNVQIITFVGINQIYAQFYELYPMSDKDTEIFKAMIELFKDKSVSYIFWEEKNAILCDNAGRPIIYCPSLGKTQGELTSAVQAAVSNTINNNDNRNYYNQSTTINEGNTTINDQKYDYSEHIYNTGDTFNGPVDNREGTFTDVNGDQYNIEDAIFDESTNTYYYHTRNGNDYYDYSVTYYINYTYVMYLGSSEQYAPEAYKLYYKLPDGRSSYDLKASELEGLSVQFNDVVSYDRAYSDNHTLGLWHFDGSTDNTSYYENVSFDWLSGASISYLESSSFGGALYCAPIFSPRGCSFTLRGSDSLISPYTFYNLNSKYGFDQVRDSGYSGNVFTKNSNFSLDFRFYSYEQSVSPSSATKLFDLNVMSIQPRSSDSSFAFGNTICSVYSNYIKNNNTNTNYSYSTGCWNQITIVGNWNNNQYSTSVYLNGVCIFISNLSFSSEQSVYSFSLYNNESTSCAYMLDEVRITDSSVSVIPSPVPYENTLVWVLPNETDLSPNTVVIQSSILNGQYRVGGIRPSFVTKGYTWLQVENSRIVSCQVYNGVIWEEVGIYIWTGSRWIPAWAFDVVTFHDYYDISDNSSNTIITSDTSFWSWFQKEFTELKTYLMSDKSNSNSGGDSNTSIIAPIVNADGTINIDADVKADINFKSILSNGVSGVTSLYKSFDALLGGCFTLIGTGVSQFFYFYGPGGEFYRINNAPSGGGSVWDY